MKAVVISKFGAADVLEVRDWPEREPGPGEVKLRTRFAGVNFADIAARIGIYKDAPKPPCVVGYEVSGVVLAVGAGVKHVSVGDRALGLTMFGGYAGEVCTLADAVRRIPDAMSDEEAAALPVNYLTAYHMLSYLTTVRPRDRVLIHAAAGGVGIAAIQLARAAGAEIFRHRVPRQTRLPALHRRGALHRLSRHGLRRGGLAPHPRRRRRHRARRARRRGSGEERALSATRRTPLHLRLLTCIGGDAQPLQDHRRAAPHAKVAPAGAHGFGSRRGNASSKPATAVIFVSS